MGLENRLSLICRGEKMLEIFIVSLFIIFALVGVSEVLHIICMALLRPKQKAQNVMVTVLNGVEAPQQLAYVLEEQKWLGRSYADRVVAVTSLLGDKRSENLKERFPNVEFVSTDELFKQIITGARNDG